MGTAEQRNQRIKQELENWGSDFRNRLSVPEIALTALLYTRFRYVLWALFAASVLGILWFGLQDVGSYYGYEAGSLFRPEHYVDTAWTATFGDSYGFSAADINRELSAMRLANLPGVLGCGVVLLASAALTFWVGLGALLAGGVWEALFKMEPSVQRFYPGALPHSITQRNRGVPRSRTSRAMRGSTCAISGATWVFRGP